MRLSSSYKAFNTRMGKLVLITQLYRNVLLKTKTKQFKISVCYIYIHQYKQIEVDCLTLFGQTFDIVGSKYFTTRAFHITDSQKF